MEAVVGDDESRVGKLAAVDPDAQRVERRRRRGRRDAVRDKALGKAEADGFVGEVGAHDDAQRDYDRPPRDPPRRGADE